MFSKLTIISPTTFYKGTPIASVRLDPMILKYRNLLSPSAVTHCVYVILTYINMLYHVF